MIKFECTKVMNFEGALRGMRNPLNSWDKSDSFIGCGEVGKNGGTYEYPYCGELCDNECHFVIGENDLDLAQRLIKAGSDHRKFLRQIFVSVDITAPLYWWKEFDTYKVGTVANSCSTMHTIHKRDLTLDDFSHDYMTDYATICLMDFIDTLNHLRSVYVKHGTKDYWYSLIQLLPSSFNQKRTVTLNYENLRNIYGSRNNHKLDEWSVGFMEWIDTLPYADELIKF